MTPVLVRYAEKEDIRDLTDLYNYYIINSSSTFDVVPKTYEERCAWFEAHPQESRYKIIAAEHPNHGIVGFTSSNPLRPKDAYNTSIETTIYVHPDHKAQRIGLQLYQKLFDELSLLAGTEEDVHRAYSCIALPNPASIALHTTFNFITVGVFHEAGKKFGTYISIQWMEKCL